MSCRGMCVCAACARKGFILSYDEREDQLSNPKQPGMFMLPGQPNMYVQQLLMQQQAAQHQLAGIQHGDGYSDDSDDDEPSDEKSSNAPPRMPLDPQLLQMKHPQAQQIFQNSQLAAELMANGVPAENIPDMLQQAYLEQQQFRIAQQQEMMGQDPQQMYASMWPGGSLNPLPSGDEEKRNAHAKAAGDAEEANGSGPVPPEGSAKPAPPEDGDRPPTQFRSPLDFARGNPAETQSLQAALLARNFAMLSYGQMAPGLHPPPGFRPPMPPLENDAMARVNIKNLVQKMRHVDNNVKRPVSEKSPPTSPSHSSGDETTTPSPKNSRGSASSPIPPLEGPAISPSKAKHARSPSKQHNNSLKAPKTLKAADAATAASKKPSPPNPASFSPPPSPPLPALFPVTASSVDFTESTPSSFPSSDTLPDHTAFDEPNSPLQASLAAKSAVALAQAAAAAEVSGGHGGRKPSQLGKTLPKRPREHRTKAD